ncbi:MAG: hypothetical protein ABIF09_04700 [Gemmatimonadota bacterium]
MRGRSRFLLQSSLPSRRHRIGALLLAFGGMAAAGCMDLNVTNVNEPDFKRALANAGDVEALIKASYNSWFFATQGNQGSQNGSPGFFLSQQAFQNSVPYTNYAMDEYGRIPRVAISTNVTWGYYKTQAHAWEGCYKALSALANGLNALEDPKIFQAIGDEMAKYRAYGKFVQGLAHGTVALLYDKGFILDEITLFNQPQNTVGHPALMEQALVYFDEAIDIADSHSFMLPFDWMQAELDSDGLVRLARSYKARFRAQVARTPEEREAVDWNAVMADVDAGIQATHTMKMDPLTGWEGVVLRLTTWYGWNMLPYFIYGMADQSGAVAEWYTLPPTEGQAAGGPAKRHLLPDGRPVLIVTPDLRFPQGSTVEEQRANQGPYVRIVTASEAGGAWNTWWRPDRGVWRWSWYKAGYQMGRDYYELGADVQAEMPLAEARLLKAEGLYRTGGLGGAAAIVNETRTAAGLNATDASGTNTSCVPRLPDGSCGDLWEMLKWEKRMETAFRGIASAGWFFDARGWGDLWKDTPLQLPIPCPELETLGLTPCYSFGGPGGKMAAPVSTYDLPFER